MKAPPTLRQLTKHLREVNDACRHPDCGACEVQLVHDVFLPGGIDEWLVQALGHPVERAYGCELVPGDDTFDAVGAARRLLAAVRDGGGE